MAGCEFMTKLIIWIPGKPLLNGYKRREFRWSEPHACYIYRGRELGPEEFNAEFDHAFKHNSDLQPRVRVVDSAPTVVPRPEPERVSRPKVRAERQALEVG